MATLALSSASSINRSNALISSSSSLLGPRSIVISTSSRTKAKAMAKAAAVAGQRKRRMISCEVALRSDSETSASVSSQGLGLGGDDEELNKATAKIGARVRVKVPLKVFHIPRVPEFDLTGMEGVLKQYVGLWKGKRISANFPYKVEFVTLIKSRGPGPVKFFAHLKEDEFDFLD